MKASTQAIGNDQASDVDQKGIEQNRQSHSRNGQEIHNQLIIASSSGPRRLESMPRQRIVERATIFAETNSRIKASCSYIDGEIIHNHRNTFVDILHKPRLTNIPK